MALTVLTVTVPIVVGTVAALVHAGDDEWQ